MGYHARTISLVCFRARKGSKRKEVKKQVKCPIKGSIEKLDRTLHFLRVLEFEVSSNNTWCCFNIMIHFPQKKKFWHPDIIGWQLLFFSQKFKKSNYQIQNIINLPFYWFRDSDSDTYLKKRNWNIRKNIFRLSFRIFALFLK